MLTQLLRWRRPLLTKLRPFLARLPHFLAHTAKTRHVGPFHAVGAGQGEAGRCACPPREPCSTRALDGPRRLHLACGLRRASARISVGEGARHARSGAPRIAPVETRPGDGQRGLELLTSCPCLAQAATAAGRSAEHAKQSAQGGSAHVGEKAQGMGEARACGVGARIDASRRAAWGKLALTHRIATPSLTRTADHFAEGERGVRVGEGRGARGCQKVGHDRQAVRGLCQLGC